MAQVRAEEASAGTVGSTNAGVDFGAAEHVAPTLGGQSASLEPRKPRRFHGSVGLRSERLSLEFGRVVQEVVQHLSDAAENVEITVEIAAGSADGFDDAVVRAVTENARTLHFTDHGFEDE